MATRAYVPRRIETFGDDAHVIEWTGLLNGDDGQPVEMPGSADRCVQFIGTFGAGGTIILEGSNEVTPTTYFPLTDPQANAISKTAAAGEQVLELTRWTRPRVTAGDGTTSLQAHMLVRRR
jgi:hypothetical protein